MKGSTSRRSVLRGAAGAAAALTGGGLLSACGGQKAGQAGRVLRIGYVSPVTGGSASFGEADGWLLKRVREALGAGITAGGRKYDVEIIDRDSKSLPERAAQVAAGLIRDEKVDLVLCTSTPETVNPVSDACEAAKIPCLSTVVPWEAWYFGRGGRPDKPFTYTYHFFMGTAEFGTAYSSLWHGRHVETNGVLGVLWPDDPDGRAIREGLGPRLEKAGFTIADPGAYADGTTDFSAQIKRFRKADAEIFNTFPLPADFNAFWQEVRQQDWLPRIATLAKTGLFPSQIERLGASGYGLSAGFWWTPDFPYTSTLTGQSARKLADAYTRDTGKQWTQILGSNMALFEVAVDALKSVSDPKDREELAARFGITKLTTVVGPLDWTTGPVRNVSTEPLVTGQWRQARVGSGNLVDPVIVDNGAFPEIPLGGTLEPLER